MNVIRSLGQYWSVRSNNRGVTTHNLCLAGHYHLIVRAGMLVNNWQHEARYCP